MSGRVESEAGPPGRHAAGLFAAAAMHRDSNGNALHAPVLVLNASYEPINVCAARRALVLVLKGVAMTEEENGHFLHAARIAMRVPSVIRLLEYRRIPHQSRALSRKNILLRDRNTCQYCATVLCSGELTLDHVIPALAEAHPPGKTSWPAAIPAIAARATSFPGGRHEADARAPRLQPSYQPPHHAAHGQVG